MNHIFSRLLSRFWCSHAGTSGAHGIFLHVPPHGIHLAVPHVDFILCQAMTSRGQPIKRAACDHFVSRHPFGTISFKGIPSQAQQGLLLVMNSCLGVLQGHGAPGGRKVPRLWASLWLVEGDSWWNFGKRPKERCVKNPGARRGILGEILVESLWIFFVTFWMTKYGRRESNIFSPKFHRFFT